jgi:hypothetical protein
MSRRLIEFFITVLVIARIKSKGAPNAQGDRATDPKKQKKQVRIDIEDGDHPIGDVEQPNTDDTKESFRSLEEEKSGYERHKVTLYMVFVAASVGSIAILLYTFWSK